MKFCKITKGCAHGIILTAVIVSMGTPTPAQTERSPTALLSVERDAPDCTPYMQREAERYCTSWAASQGKTPVAATITINDISMSMSKATHGKDYCLEQFGVVCTATSVPASQRNALPRCPTDGIALTCMP